MRGSFDDYYMSLVEIKKIKVFIFNTPSFNQPVKNKHEAYKRFVEMSNNNDYTTGNLLNHSYHQKSYKFTGIDSIKLILDKKMEHFQWSIKCKLWCRKRNYL